MSLSNKMNFILYFDYAAIVILAFQFLTVLMRKQTEGINNKLYLIMLGLSFLATTFDIVSSFDFVPLQGLTILCSFYFLFRNTIALFLFLYSLSLSKIYYEFQKKKYLFSFILLPITIYTVLLIVNFFYPLLFYYEPGPAFFRGAHAWITYTVGYTYFFGGLFIILRVRNNYSKSKLALIALALIMQAGSSIFQIFFSKVLVEMFFSAFSLLFLSVFVEKAEDYIDYKTMLPNTNSFHDFIKRNIEVKRPFSIYIMHLSNLPNIYNIYTYDDAIAYLRLLGNRITSTAKGSDPKAVSYFFDPDSFVIAFPNKENGKKIQSEITLLLRTFIYTKNPQPFHLEGKDILVHYPQDFQVPGQILTFIASFYSLLSNTSANGVLSQTPIQNQNHLLFNLEKILDDAIKNKTFEMYYQPIFSIKENKFLSTEALVRLPYNGKFISPALFIPFAERFGKMNQIGNIILDKIFAFISSEEYRSSGIQYTNINLSITQLLDEKFIERLEDKRMENHLDISEVYLELTEGVAISGDKTIEGNIYGLDKAGYHISLDDFGVGYSNIARLTKLPVSLLKFDKSLVDQLNDPHIKSFLISLIQIVKDFGMEVLVEGVETKENADFLKEHDADKIQGFYYSKPLCEKDLIEFLKQHNQ